MRLGQNHVHFTQTFDEYVSVKKHRSIYNICGHCVIDWHVKYWYISIFNMTRDLPCPPHITLNTSKKQSQHHPSHESLHQCSIVVKSQGFPILFISVQSCTTRDISSITFPSKNHGPIWDKYLPTSSIVFQHCIAINHIKLTTLASKQPNPGVITIVPCSPDRDVGPGKQRDEMLRNKKR